MQGERTGLIVYGGEALGWSAPFSVWKRDGRFKNPDDPCMDLGEIRLTRKQSDFTDPKKLRAALGF